MVLRLTPAGAQPAADAPWYRNDSIVIDRTDAGDLVIRFADATSFRIAADGRAIELLSAPPKYTSGDLAAYALGPVAAVALHLQGAVLFHAAAVVMRGKAVLFAGESGSGKSTIAAILHRQGYGVMSDDITELDGDRALTSVPAVRLWPDALESLYGSAAAAFPDRAPSWDKKIVPVEDAGAPRAVAAILFLDSESRGAEPRLARLTPREGWQRLMSCAFTARLPDEAMSRRIFESTAGLADGVAMYSFAPPLRGASGELGAWLERALAEPLR